jgi:hypothetical protein
VLSDGKKASLYYTDFEGKSRVKLLLIVKILNKKNKPHKIDLREIANYNNIPLKLNKRRGYARISKGNRT